MNLLTWLCSPRAHSHPEPIANGPETFAERELLDAIRADGPPRQIQVTRRRDGWTVSTTRLDGLASSVGRGSTFDEAWCRQCPRER